MPRAACGRGETGRRAGLKIPFRKECRFDPDRPHHPWPRSIAAAEEVAIDAAAATTEAARRARGRPRLEDVAGIEGRLLAVALQEFLRHGYGATSLTRIIAAAGISKTTLYSRYPSKEQLFRAIIDREIERLAPTEALRSDAGPLALEPGLVSYANRTLEISLEGNLLEVNRLIHSEANRFPELGHAAAKRTQSAIAQIAGFIRQCAEADHIPCRDPDSIAEAFIFALRGWYGHVMLGGRRVSVAERRDWAARAVHALVSSRADW